MTPGNTPASEPKIHWKKPSDKRLSMVDNLSKHLDTGGNYIPFLKSGERRVKSGLDIAIRVSLWRSAHSHVP